MVERPSGLNASSFTPVICCIILTSYSVESACQVFSLGNKSRITHPIITPAANTITIASMSLPFLYRQRADYLVSAHHLADGDFAQMSRALDYLEGGA